MNEVKFVTRFYFGATVLGVVWIRDPFINLFNFIIILPWQRRLLIRIRRTKRESDPLLLLLIHSSWRRFSYPIVITFCQPNKLKRRRALTFGTDGTLYLKVLMAIFALLVLQLQVGQLGKIQFEQVLSLGLVIRRLKIHSILLICVAPFLFIFTATTIRKLILLSGYLIWQVPIIRLRHYVTRVFLLLLLVWVLFFLRLLRSSLLDRRVHTFELGITPPGLIFASLCANRVLILLITIVILYLHHLIIVCISIVRNVVRIICGSSYFIEWWNLSLELLLLKLFESIHSILLIVSTVGIDLL